MASRVAKQNIKGEPKMGVSAPKGVTYKSGKDKDGEKQKKR